MMLRPLGAFEKAALVSNKYAPFNVTIVVRIENPPSPEIIRGSLDGIQQSHPLLKARVGYIGNVPWFEEDPESPQIPLEIFYNPTETDWKSTAEEEMARTITFEDSPLLRAVYLYSKSYSVVIQR